MPDDAAPLARLPRGPDPPHRLIHRNELPVARQLADRLPAVDFEHDEVPHDVEQVPWFQQPVQEDVLRCRLAPEPLAEVLHAQGIRLLPCEEEPRRRADRPVDRLLAAGTDENLRRFEQPRRPQVLPLRAGLLVAVELLDRFRLPGVTDGRALALDDRQRQTIHEHDDVRNDMLLRPQRLELPRDDPLVALGLVEVDIPDRVALAPAAPVLLQRNAVGERRIDLLVRLRETGRRHLRHRLHRPGDVGLRQPGIQALEGRRKASGKDGLLEGRALAYRGLRAGRRRSRGTQAAPPRGSPRGAIRPSRSPSRSCGGGIRSDAELAGEEDGHERGLYSHQRCVTFCLNSQSVVYDAQRPHYLLSFIGRSIGNPKPT